MVEKEEIIQEEPSLRGRQRLRDVLSKIHPDKTYGDDEADIDDMLSEYESVNSKYGDLEGASSRIAEGVRANPRVASLFQDIIEKRNPMPSIVRAYGKDVLSMDPESDEFKEIVLAEDERVRSMAEESKRTEEKDAEFQKNLESSGKVFESFAAKNNMDEDTFRDFFQRFYELFAMPIFEGIYTEEMLDAAKKALSYDSDIKDAMDAGKVAGKNEKIIVEKKKQVGDGIPGLQETSGAVVVEKPKQASRKSIWDAGR